MHRTHEDTPARLALAIVVGVGVGVATVGAAAACASFGAAPDEAASRDAGMDDANDTRPSDDARSNGFDAARDGTTGTGCSPVAFVCDTYKRANTPSGWGLATSGQPWEGDATGDRFSIFEGTGRIASQNTPFSVALIGGARPDAEVVVVALATGVPLVFGAALRAASTNTYYLARINQAQFEIDVVSAGAVSTLLGRTFSTTPEVSYTIRFRAVGAALKARLWRTTDTEPQTWTVEVTDSALGPGKAGFAGSLGAGATATVFHFEVSPP